MQTHDVSGHRAYAPTLIGHSPADERVGITHSDCVNSVVSYIRHHDLQDVILVGHSFGGSVISKAVEYLPGRIKKLIFLDAFVLADGQSMYDNLPGFLIELLDQLAQASTRGRKISCSLQRAVEHILVRTTVNLVVIDLEQALVHFDTNRPTLTALPDANRPPQVLTRLAGESKNIPPQRHIRISHRLRRLNHEKHGAQHCEQVTAGLRLCPDQRYC